MSKTTTKFWLVVRASDGNRERTDGDVALRHRYTSRDKAREVARELALRDRRVYYVAEAIDRVARVEPVEVLELS